VLEAEEEDEPELAPPEAEFFLQRKTGRYECGSCAYEYNPFWGEGKIGPGTRWEDIPEDWRCPKCNAAKEEFLPIVEEVAGFADNQDYGLGFNTWTASQKSAVIWGGLALGAAGLLYGYALE